MTAEILRASPRQRALDALGLTRRSADVRFRSIVELAATVLDTPIAAITVLDDKHQWFFSSVGLDAEKGARCDAFCEHTLALNDVFVVEDSHQDARFRDNPMVRGAPNIRFYAGAPVVLELGLTVGALIVIDRAPRRLDDKEQDILRKLAASAADALKLQEASLKHFALARDQDAKRKQLSEQNVALRRSQQIFDIASELANFGSWAVDLETEAVSWSDGVRRIHGVPDSFEPTLADAVAFYEPEAQVALSAAFAEAVATGGRYDIELPLRRADGERIWVRSIGQIERENGVARRAFGCVMDVTAEHEARSALERQAQRDPLTGLLNRRALAPAFDALQASLDLTRERLLLLAIDLDNFKAVNDSAGHEAGDAVLVQCADLLRDGLGDGVAGRLGGDEFVVIQKVAAQPEALRRQADAILDRFRFCGALDRFDAPVTPSIGGVSIGLAATTFEAALRRADAALYEAKRTGKARAVDAADLLASAS